MNNFVMFVLIFLLAVPQDVSAYCYTRNGTSITDVAYQPCNNATSDSACCGINHDGAGHAGTVNDICEDNGLCQNFEAYDGTNEGQQLWWRQGCTDPTWQSPYCLKDVCNGSEYEYDNAPVRNCGGESWCCGSEGCCDETTSVFQLAATIGPTSTTPSSTSAPTSSVVTTASPATSSPALNIASTGGLSTGAKAGIGVGVAVLVILVVVVAILVMRLKKSKAGKQELANTDAQYTDAPMGVHEQKYGTVSYAQEDSRENAVFELGERQRAELAANPQPQELDGRNGSVRGSA